jgi:hypothetical protein
MSAAALLGRPAAVLGMDAHAGQRQVMEAAHFAAAAHDVSRMRPHMKLMKARIISPVARMAVGKRGTRPVWRR